ncbi:MAG: LysR family transcriptional regulator [Pseudomonadota bacterium]
MDELRALRYFVAVAELGSFTTAAKQFNVPPSSVSRRIADLEQSLGASLLNRTTRSVQLTEIGREYLLQVRDILHQLGQSNESVRSYHAKPMGQLKISSLVGFGERVLLPLLDKFSEIYPDIVLDLSLSDELSTLSRDDVDIAVRGGYAPNERVLAIRLMDNKFVPIASPKYLQQVKPPKHPSELKVHNGLIYRTPAGPQRWFYQEDDIWHTASINQIAISNSVTWLAERALSGDGIMMAPTWALTDHLSSGDLQILSIEPELKVTQRSELAIYLLYQKQRYLVPKVKVAVDFLVAHIPQPHIHQSESS